MNFWVDPLASRASISRTVLVKLAFTGAFRPSDRQTGSPSRAKGFLRPRGDQPRSISAAIFPPKSRSKSSPKIGRRQIDDIYAVSIGYRKSYGGFGTFEPLGPTIHGLGVDTADMLVSEVFYRDIPNRQALARYGGLTESPNESGQKRRGKGTVPIWQPACSKRPDPICLAVPEVPTG